MLCWWARFKDVLGVCAWIKKFDCDNLSGIWCHVCDTQNDWRNLPSAFHELWSGGMKKSLILRSWIITLILCLTFLSWPVSSSSLGVVEERQAKFKESKKGMRVLRDSIKSQDKNEALHAVDFHIAWSRKLPAMFPQGSEASISNGSDASGDIWQNFEWFERLNLDYQKTALMVRSELDQVDYDAAMRNFFKMARSCKACHENFRN